MAERFLHVVTCVVVAWVVLVLFVNAAIWMLTAGLCGLTSMWQMLPVTLILTFLPACMIGIQYYLDGRPREGR